MSAYRDWQDTKREVSAYRDWQDAKREAEWTAQVATWRATLLVRAIMAFKGGSAEECKAAGAEAVGAERVAVEARELADRWTREAEELKAEYLAAKATE